LKKFLLYAVLILFGFSANAQVGINTTTPDPSSVLDVTSTTKGLLPPRMTTTQRIGIASPAAGLIIFNTTTNCLEYYNGTIWVSVCGNLPSTNGTAVVSAYVCNTAFAGTMTAGTAVSGVTQTITAAVTTVGSYSISTSANGVTFAAAGTFSGTGSQNIVLTATGTPTAAGSNTFTLNTTPNCSFNRITNANGVIADNATCTTATISVSGCASVPGATLNDDGTTAEGIEYDWTGGTTNLASATAGQGPGNGVTTRALVEIAGQCWYRINADKIPTAGQPAWVNSTDVGWNDYYTSGPYTNEGRLYQWSAAMNASTTERSQGICATGFHVPSDCEWMYLENAMGMTTTAQQAQNWRDNPGSGTGTGSHLSTRTLDFTNKSGFSALLAGRRTALGTFSARTSIGHWWSSSASGASDAFYRALSTGYRGVVRAAAGNRAFGFSVRCLKD
jgi:uncharacterized protein (TIGR02145 family)